MLNEKEIYSTILTRILDYLKDNLGIKIKNNNVILDAEIKIKNGNIMEWMLTIDFMNIYVNHKYKYNRITFNLSIKEHFETVKHIFANLLFNDEKYFENDNIIIHNTPLIISISSPVFVYEGNSQYSILYDLLQIISGIKPDHIYNYFKYVGCVEIKGKGLYELVDAANRIDDKEKFSRYITILSSFVHEYKKKDSDFCNLYVELNNNNIYFEIDYYNKGVYDCSIEYDQFEFCKNEYDLIKLIDMIEKFEKI